MLLKRLHSAFAFVSLSSSVFFFLSANMTSAYSIGGLVTSLGHLQVLRFCASSNRPFIYVSHILYMSGGYSYCFLDI